MHLANHLDDAVNYYQTFFFSFAFFEEVTWNWLVGEFQMEIQKLSFLKDSIFENSRPFSKALCFLLS